MTAPLVDDIRALVAGDEDADEILRAVVRTVVEDGLAVWAGILFVEAGDLVLGPQAGSAAPESRTTVPVVYEGTRVAELAVDGCGDRELLAQVANLVALQCLVGWDTGGVPWDETEA